MHTYRHTYIHTYTHTFTSINTFDTHTHRWARSSGAKVWSWLFSACGCGADQKLQAAAAAAAAYDHRGLHHWSAKSIRPRSLSQRWRLNCFTCFTFMSIVFHQWINRSAAKQTVRRTRRKVKSPRVENTTWPTLQAVCLHTVFADCHC